MSGEFRAHLTFRSIYISCCNGNVCLGLNDGIHRYVPMKQYIMNINIDSVFYNYVAIMHP